MICLFCQKSDVMEYIMKYQSDLDAIASCPPSTAVAGDREAYRICKAPISAQQFLPPGKQDPKRVSNALDKDNQEYACALLGLSLFDTKEAVEQRWHSFPLKVKKKLGNWVGFFEVDSVDGLLGRVSQESRHYELYEYAQSQVYKKVKLIEELEG